MTAFLVTVRSCVLDNLLSTTSRTDTPDQLSFACLNVFTSRRLLLVITPWLFFCIFLCLHWTKTSVRFLAEKKLKPQNFDVRTVSKFFVLYMKSNVLLLVVILTTATSLLHCLSLKVTTAVILHSFLTTFSRIFRF